MESLPKITITLKKGASLMYNKDMRYVDRRRRPFILNQDLQIEIPAMCYISENSYSVPYDGLITGDIHQSFYEKWLSSDEDDRHMMRPQYLNAMITLPENTKVWIDEYGIPMKISESTDYYISRTAKIIVPSGSYIWKYKQNMPQFTRIDKDTEYYLMIY
jgi:hypothetical protein